MSQSESCDDRRNPRGARAETDGNGSFRDHVAGGLFRSVTYTSTAVSVQNLLSSEGNTDGDRDVDTVDLTGMIMNFNGGSGCA